MTILLVMCEQNQRYFRGFYVSKMLPRR
jgi:hypothetical protein